MSPSFLTDAQLHAELRRCLGCETRPCRSGCPASCSPADFIRAARGGERSDYWRAAAHILAHNPLGGVCGSVCPDTLCMASCARRGLDAAVNVPAVQAAIVRKARQLGVLRRVDPPPATGHRIAVVGAGPAGLGATSVLAKAGHTVRVFDRARRPGGMARLIPGHRLDPEVLASDVAGLLGIGDVHLVLGRPVALPRDLLAKGFAAVIVAAGLSDAVELDVPGRERALGFAEVLGSRPPALRGRRVAIVGDGAVALDCAEAALARGAAHVELLALRSLSELELSRRERDRLFASGVHVTCRVRVAAIRGRGARVTALELRKVELPEGEAFHPERLADLRHGEQVRRDLDVVILATGSRPGLRLEPHPRVVYAGDVERGPSSVVEALAAGKRAGLAVHGMLAGDDAGACPDRLSCPDGNACPRRTSCPEWNRKDPVRASGGAGASAGLPVSLTSHFFGRPLGSPFLLGAGPATGSYARMKRAYEAGWPGGVMTAADAELEVCSDLERLGREFPDRLTLAAAGGPVTGDDEADARLWQATTRKLDAAGAMGVEYSLHHSLGGGGTGRGAVTTPEAAARIVDWVLAVSDPRVPKLFRIDATAAAIDGLLASVAGAFARHPEKPAGVTLAGSLPAPALGPGASAPAGDTAASPLGGALGSAARHGLVVSSEGGATDHRAAARLLELGARSVQLDGIVTRHGLGVVSDLHGGLSYLLAERGLRSVSELVGCALGPAFPAAGALAAARIVCQVDPALCLRCGNCSRCVRLAVALDARGNPAIDPAVCAGCGSCVQQCSAGALALRAVA